MCKIKTLKNSNGESYTILSQEGNNYLLLSPSEKTLIVANGWDEKTLSWDSGHYYDNTPENLQKASQGLLHLSKTFKDICQEKINVFQELPYEEKFRALVEIENPDFKNLSSVEIDNLYSTWFDNSDGVGFIDMEPVYEACKELEIDPASLSERNMRSRVFVDMDGVLAEYRPCKSIETLYQKGYFASLKAQNGVIDGLKEFMKYNPGIDIYVLSAVLSDSHTALDEKNQWLDQNFNIPAKNRIFVPCGENKADFVPGGVRKSDVLIDDYTVNLLQWEKDGGRGIKLMNGQNGTKGRWDGKRIDKDYSAEFFSTELSSFAKDESVDRRFGDILQGALL